MVKDTGDFAFETSQEVAVAAVVDSHAITATKLLRTA
jgi:hypothetical protein